MIISPLHHLGIVISIVNEKFPEIQANIKFVDDLKAKGQKESACGMARFKEGKVTDIFLNINIPFLMENSGKKYLINFTMLIAKGL